MMPPKDQAPTAAPTPAQTGLKLAPVNMQGRALGLLPGDVLLRLDGRPIEGEARQLVKVFNTPPHKPHLLDIRRNGQVWSVLSPTATLGRWKPVDVTEAISAGPSGPAGMRNWDVLVNEDGIYDTHPHSPPLLALLAPVYLVHMRLWAALAVWGALTLLGVAIGWVMGAAIQALICVYVWRTAPTLFRTTRHASGFRLWRCIAAPSEADLHREVSRLEPGLAFVFARQAAAGETPAT